jgi:hypothetical protein
MIDPKSLTSKSPTELTILFKELHQQDVQHRLAHFGVMADAGAVLSELHERHLAGALGKGGWSAYCRKLGITRADAGFLIAAFRAKDDPAEFMAQVYQLHEEREKDRTERATKGGKTIFIKAPGVIFGYLTALGETARRELWALCWRNYGREMRKVGDELGWDDETGDVARPTGHA